MFTDLKLAERLEEVEAFAAAAYVRRLAQRRPDIDTAVEEVAGGLAVFAGAGSPLSETKAMGLHGPVSDADLDRIENIFFSRGEPSRVVVCPLADPSLVEGLGRRGYRLSHFENILAMPLDASNAETASTPGIEVRPISLDEGDLYARVVAPNFVAPGEPVDEMIDMALTMVGVEQAVSFLAWIDGEPAGGGAVIVQPRTGAARRRRDAPSFSQSRGPRRASPRPSGLCAAPGLRPGRSRRPTRQHFPAQRRAPRAARRLHAGIAHSRAGPGLKNRIASSTVLKMSQ